MHNIDVTGLTALADLTRDVRSYAGKKTEVRFVGVAEGGRVRERFARWGWELTDMSEVGKVVDGEANEAGKEKPTRVYKTVADALARRGRTLSEDAIQPVEVLVVGGEKGEV